MSEIKITTVIPLRNMCILPGSITHFDLSRKISIASLEKAMQMEQCIYVVTQRNAEINEPQMQDLYEVGTYASIKQIIKMPNKIVRVLVEGASRAKLQRLEIGKELVAEIELLANMDDLEPLEEEAMKRQVLEAYENLLKAMQKKDFGVVKALKHEKNLSNLLDQIAVNVFLDYEKRQQLLELVSIKSRFETLMKLIEEETEIANIRSQLAKDVKSRVEKNQKDYVLREQMHLIREELGEEGNDSDIDNMRKKLEKISTSEEIKTRINKSISKLASMSEHSSEYAVMYNYVELLLEMPWEKASKDCLDLEKSSAILEADHYGMEKIKERILEYLAVRKLNEEGQPPILCLVGPPGTGKTSIAKSMAKAMNKEYVRVCLGGVRDEAEIRGHRRTYVGALPGRIVTALKQAGTSNPLILLDEIDKMGRDYKGDTAAALLEVLDAEQNKHFQDHYLEIPLDLSKVTFVATANDISQLDGPLRDRMEVLELSSYTEKEKLHIARQYLVKKQLKAHGLKKSQLKFTDKALEEIITSYTKEAGVRQLERQIGKVCRKYCVAIVKEEDSLTDKVTGKNVAEYLGTPKYRKEKIGNKDEIGIVRGLAWTSVGGVTLEVEVGIMPGKGEVKLTGQLGDVMKESAMTGISYIRSIGPQYDVADDFFEKHDIHIHIPEGATPKDGPSAGITMAVAVLSAITGRKAKADVAMTGEITLRGRVMAIGGLKEKLLAAKLAGVKTVLIPDENKLDLSDISEEIKSGINIMPVSRMEEVIAQVLV